MKEEIIWKDVKGFEGYYKVNSLGEVWRIQYTSCDVFDKLKRLNSTGVGVVILSKTVNKKKIEKGFQVIPLIYDCFYPNRRFSIECIDGNKMNLAISNLRETKKRIGLSNAYTSEELERMASLYKKGESTIEIGKKIGCTSATVKTYLKKANLWKSSFLSEKDKTKIKKLLKKGEKQIKIAKMFGVATSTIHLIKKTL